MRYLYLGKSYSVRIKRADLDKDNSSEAHKMIGNYYVIKTVGQGSYGKVKLACHKDTKENVMNFIHNHIHIIL